MYCFSVKEKETIRANYPHIEAGHIYLNHAAISPLSLRIQKAINHFLLDRQAGEIDNFMLWEEQVESVRRMTASLIHAPSAQQISFCGNTSDAISAVTEGLHWVEGDEVILNTHEFPSNVQPYRILESKGVRIIYADPGPAGVISRELIEAHISPRTRCVSLSAVQFLSGFRAGLKEIGELCREHDLIFVVDGIQALGATDIDVQACHIDALCTGCHKWLMAPMGIGFLFLSDRLQKVLRPYKTGWLSVAEPWELTNFDQQWKPICAHLESGTQNMTGLTGLHESLRTFMEYGLTNIYSEVRSLTDYLYERLSEIEGVTLVTSAESASRAGIVSFTARQLPDVEQEVQRLRKKKISISAREQLYRISPHYYSLRSEIDQTIDNLFDL